jgi:hypothetical protein
MTLPELIKALEAAEGPSLRLDYEIDLALGIGEINTAPYTRSVDATIALCERVLPGWRLCFEAVNGKADDLYILGPDYRDDQPWLNSSKPIAGKPIALAICLAVLQAKLSQDGGGDE